VQRSRGRVEGARGHHSTEGAQLSEIEVHEQSC